MIIITVWDLLQRFARRNDGAHTVLRLGMRTGEISGFALRLF